jgi:hypothetical protein
MRKTLALGILAALPSCGGSSPSAPVGPPPTTLPSQGSFTASFSPSPIIAQDCTPALCGSSTNRFLATGALTITESAGLAGNVDFVLLTLRNATTGVELTPVTYTANDMISRSSTGSNHIPANGSITIRPLGIIYTLSFGGRQGTLTYAIQVTDDRGNRHNLVVTVQVV